MGSALEYVDLADAENRKKEGQNRKNAEGMRKHAGSL
jgi:hypothetical protein